MNSTYLPMSNNSSLNPSISLTRVDEVKNKLIDKFILIGTLLFLFIFVFAPWDFDAINIDVFIEFAALIFLFMIYWQRSRIHVKIKTAIILVMVFIVFISDLLQFGISSGDKDLLILIPFLSILVYDLRTTIFVFILALFSYFSVAFLSLEGQLVQPLLQSSPITALDWFGKISTPLIIAVVLTTFVNSFNQSIIEFISNLEKTNVDLKERDKSLEASLEEKNVMIQEIHHRVKNNLAVVSGLLELQSLTLVDEDIQYIFSKTTNRIMSIAKVHEMIYESSDFSDVPFDNYVQELAEIITKSINREDKIIEFEFDIRVESMSINHGVPLGIIFSELITNSIKYGFNETQNNLIKITVTHNGEYINAVYADNGVGISNIDEVSEKSLGFTLIHSLFDQIEATYSYDTDEKFKLEFTFPADINTDVNRNLKANTT